MSVMPSMPGQAATASTRPGADDRPEFSIVMPCLNEARTVGRCIEKAREAIDRLGIDAEVVVSDNGSTDGSLEVARSRGARVVAAERRGYGSALQAGIAAARGRHVILGDADDSYDFASIEPFVERLRQGDDLVVGNRFRGGIRPGAMPWLHRRIGNPALTGILNLFFRSPIRDAHCGLRAIRKESYDRLGLESSGMEFASEMVVKACLHGLKISEVPTVLHPDGRDRRPHLRSFRDGWRHLRLLLLLCPTWLFLVPSAFLMAAGLGLMAWLTPDARMAGPVGLGVHTMVLGALLVLVAYQMLWMWAHAKCHGWISGILPTDRLAGGLVGHFNLEHGLLAGLALVVAGVGADAWLVAEWVDRGLGPLEVRSTLRYAVWGLTTIMLGAQTISGSFLLSMQRMGAGDDAACRRWRLR